MKGTLDRAVLCASFLWVALVLFCTGVAASEKVHVVKRKETLYAIAKKYKTAPSKIAQRNHLKDSNRLQAGQRLVIPNQTPFKEYVVKKGDSVAVIAKKAGVAPVALVECNRLNHPDKIDIGQVIRIPLSKSDASSGSSKASKSAGPALDAGVKKQLDRVRCSKRWKYVVIHHSANFVDTPKSMNAHHLRRGMQHGLAYHFVIGNGNRTKDGDIYVGNRWKRQLDGGHLASSSLNRRSIGICLVGDFNKRAPSANQMKSLKALSNYLMRRCRIRKDRVKTHCEINPKPTECPGKRFPSAKFRAAL